MIIKYIEYELTSHGFVKEKINTGHYYTKILKNIEFVCTIERDARIYFITVYRWGDNKIRGSYSISYEDLKNSPDFSPILFKRTIENMPQYIGKEVDIHTEIIKAINAVFSSIV
ncbi:MAG: hypothetical protein E6767_13325 [Dysgonomonas sp.]|nr:hypothetical protein [Dysgonomonas sp.]